MRARRLLLGAVLSLAACSYVRSEHYPQAGARGLVHLGQTLDNDNRVIDAHGELHLHKKALFIQVQTFQSSPGVHVLRCRLLGLHGDLLDEQSERSATPPGQDSYLGICHFQLHSDQTPGLWHYDVEVDGMLLRDSSLVMRP